MKKEKQKKSKWLIWIDGAQLYSEHLRGLDKRIACSKLVMAT